MQLKAVYRFYIESMYDLLVDARLFHDGGSFPIETSTLIWRVNPSNGSYTIETSAMKELKGLIQTHYQRMLGFQFWSISYMLKSP